MHKIFIYIELCKQDGWKHRAFLTAEEVVGLLDSDEKDNHWRSAGMDIIFPGSDDEFGFEEEEVDNRSDSEGEEEWEAEL